MEIDISDDGPGIPAMVQDSVFEPFVTFGKPEGSGLGLAIVKKILEDHGGIIRLVDKCETGTSFKITIPFSSPG